MMDTKTPLFQSALELLAHGISHYNSGGELDRKLLILHLANAVELILKDLVLSSGSSIYKSPKETISIHGCLSKLKESQVEVPQLNKIELLIDERNALQHRYGSPNELSAIFYMGIASDFFSEVLKEHYDLELDDLLDDFLGAVDLAAFRARTPSDDTGLEELGRLARVHPLGAFLSTANYAERLVWDLIRAKGLRVFMGSQLGFRSHRALARYGLKIPVDLESSLQELERTRRRTASGREEPTSEDVDKAVKEILRLESVLSKLDESFWRTAIEDSENERVRSVGGHSGSPATLARESAQQVNSGDVASEPPV